MSVPGILSILTARTVEAVSVLAVAGHGIDPAKVPDVNERAAKLVRSPKARNRAFGSYLDFHAPAMQVMGFPPEEPDAVLNHMHLPRCGLPDILPVNASRCRWTHEPVTTKLGDGWRGLQLFTEAQMRAAIEWSNSRWCEVGGSVWKWHASGDPGPNQLVHYVRIDGPSNVLADQMLPCGVRRDTECRMRLDSSEFGKGGLYERFGYEYMRAVVTHEDGHKWGHEHSRDARALMYPSARPEVLDLGGDDIERHRATYGAPKGQPTPKPDEPKPTPTPQPPTPPNPQPGPKLYALDGILLGGSEPAFGGKVKNYHRVKGHFFGQWAQTAEAPAIHEALEAGETEDTP